MEPVKKKTSTEFNGQSACLVVCDYNDEDVFIMASDILYISGDNEHDTCIYIKTDNDNAEYVRIDARSDAVFDCWVYAKSTGKILDLRPMCDQDGNPRKKTLLKRVKEYKPGFEHFTF